MTAAAARIAGTREARRGRSGVGGAEAGADAGAGFVGDDGAETRIGHIAPERRNFVIPLQVGAHEDDAVIGRSRQQGHGDLATGVKAHAVDLNFCFKRLLHEVNLNLFVPSFPYLEYRDHG